MQFRGHPPRRHEPFGLESHHEDEGDAEHGQPPPAEGEEARSPGVDARLLDPGIRPRGEHRVEAEQQHDTHERARDAPQAAEDHGTEHHDRSVEVVGIRIGGGREARGVEASRKARHGRRDAEGGELHPHRGDAHRRRGELVLTYGDPRPAEPRLLEPPHREHDRREGEEREVVEPPRVHRERHAEVQLAEFHLRARRRHRVEPLHAACDLLEVAERDLHHLAEPERDDREVVASQPQGRAADRQADPGREEHAHGRRRQEPDLEGKHRHRQDRQGVGADPEEGGDPQVQQPRVADHHVEAERQDAVDEERGHLPTERPTQGRHDQWQRREHRQRHDLPPPGQPGQELPRQRLRCDSGGRRHTFSLVRRPSSPSGRKTRITIRIANTIAPVHRSPK